MNIDPQEAEDIADAPLVTDVHHEDGAVVTRGTAATEAAQHPAEDEPEEGWEPPARVIAGLSDIVVEERSIGAAAGSSIGAADFGSDPAPGSALRVGDDQAIASYRQPPASTVLRQQQRAGRRRRGPMSRPATQTTVSRPPLRKCYHLFIHEFKI